MMMRWQPLLELLLRQVLRQVGGGARLGGPLPGSPHLQLLQWLLQQVGLQQVGRAAAAAAVPAAPASTLRMTTP